MNIWQMAEWAAWIVSALLLLWMVVDAYRTGQNYSDDTLMSSREGVDDLFGGDHKKGA